MHRVDHPTATASVPTPDPVGTPGFFTKGNPVLAIPATRVTQDWLNAVQEEIANAVEREGLPLDKGDRFQLSKVLQKVRAGSGFTNLLQNPEFDIAQRGPTVAINPADPGTSSFVGTPLAGPDRWRYRLGGAGDQGQWTAEIDALFTLNDIPASGATSYATLTRNASASGVRPAIEQAIEGVANLAGEPVVLAFDARKHQGSDPEGDVELVELIQVFGQTGSPSSSVTTTLAALETHYDAGWKRLVFSGTLPTVSGKTIAAGHHLLLRIHFTDQTASASVDVTGFSLQRGQTDPGYTSRGRGLELLICQRYYEHSRANTSAGIGQTSFNAGGEEVGLWDTAFDGGGKVRTLGRRFAVPKYLRTTTVVLPVVVWKGTGVTADQITEGAATNHAVTSADVNFEHTGFPEITAPPAGGTLREFRARWSASMEILL